MAKRRYFLIRNASEPACFFAIVGTPPRSSSPTGSWSRRSAVGKCSSLHARVLVRACAAVLVCWLLVLRRLRRPPNEPMHAGNGPPVLELELPNLVYHAHRVLELWRACTFVFFLRPMRQALQWWWW